MRGRPRLPGSDFCHRRLSAGHRWGPDLGSSTPGDRAREDSEYILMRKDIQLLLIETVDNLGIVGDVVKVRAGYARNYLLPRGLATTPDESLIASLAEKRKVAEVEQGKLRTERETLVKRLDGIEITMQRACNDLGLLYGSVTQQDISGALSTLGFAVKPREIRLPQVIKRLGQFEVNVKLTSDLEEHVQIHVIADREMAGEEREEMEFDNEGELIVKKAKKAPAAPAAEATPAE
ncbi:MAG: 50S ribosomal protein L9 [Phycisphaera sp.]|nr:MAG: 50S ribosomal protein L9 [Phycisphaera sp.]